MDPTTLDAVPITLDRERSLLLTMRTLRQVELRLRTLTDNPRLTVWSWLDGIRDIGLTELSVFLAAGLAHEDPTITEDRVLDLLTVDRIVPAGNAVVAAINAAFSPASATAAGASRPLAPTGTSSSPSPDTTSASPPTSSGVSPQDNSMR
jgi:hypothetical protein